MGRFLFYSIHFYFLLCLISDICCEEDNNTRGPKRTKISPYAGLVPFLRTGRSGIPILAAENEEEILKRTKPIRIMAFPRVGRSGTMELGDEEKWDLQMKNINSNDMNGGFWFGPRLGRIQKRPWYKQNIPLAYLVHRDYTPRLGIEFESTLEDETDDTSSEHEDDKAVP